MGPFDDDGAGVLFLMCSERSGSNLIRAMLDAHAEVVAPPSLHVGRDVGGQLFALDRAEDRAAALDDLTPSLRKRLVRHLGEELAASVEASLGGEPAADFGDYLRRLYAPVLEHHGGARRLVVKENHVHTQLFFLLHAFPKARFVFQVRDPRDYLASVKARVPGWLGNKYGSVRRALEVWREDQIGGLNALAHLGPERVWLQRYEDLIGDAPRVLGGLCEFLGLPFDEAMLEFHRGESAQKMAQDGGQWENLDKPLISDNSRKYRTTLNKRTIKLVEAHLGDLMELFGYELDFERRDQAGVLASMLPQMSEPVERWANGERELFHEAADTTFARPLARRRRKVPLPYVGEG